MRFLFECEKERLGQLDQIKEILYFSYNWMLNF